MTTANENATGGAAGVIEDINRGAEIIGSLVPTVGAIAGAVRLILTAVRPSDAQKAQPFDQASAALKSAIGDLNNAVAGFEAAKKAAAEKAAGSGSGSSVAGMSTGSHGALTKPSEG